MPGAGVGAGIGLAVLSQDDRLLDALEEVVTADHAILVCTGEGELADQVLSGKCGVALIDAQTAPGSVAELARRLRQQFPDLVLVVAGGAEHQAQLASQIASGEIYRFLHKPVSAQRVRLFVEAALRRHDEEHAVKREAAALAVPQRARASAANAAATGSSPKPPAAPLSGNALLAIVAAVVVGAGLWYATRGTGPKAPPAGTGAANVLGADGKPARAPDAAALAQLDLADKALARGQATTPPGQSAADLYRGVLQKYPGEPRAVAGIERIVNSMLTEAEQHFLQDKLDDAARLIEGARALQPDNVRIAFLSAQLGKERERALLAKARAAAASGDLSKALAVLSSSAPDGGAGAGATGGGVVAEARKALEQQQVDERVRSSLKLASERIARGALTEPAGDNARFYIESARALAPRDPNLPRLQQQLAARVLAEARAAVAKGDSAAANRWLRSAADTGVDASDIDQLKAQLTGVQGNARSAEVGRLAALVSQRIAQNRLVDPPNDSAKSLYAALAEADTGGTVAPALRQSLSRAYLAQAQDAITRSDFSGAQRWVGEAELLGAPAADIAAMRSTITTGRDRLNQQAQVVAVSDLKRTRFVEPTYPSQAKARNIEGWVELEFTVKTDGSVTDVKVTQSEPAAIFDLAAVQAVAKWRFEPVLRDGALVDPRARLRLRFKLT
jgi:TonB family protein